MAICTDETPRIHYYSLFNKDMRGTRRQSFLQWMIRAYPPALKKPHPHLPDGRLDMLANHCLQSRPSQWSWTEANRFLYLWDAGLQSACRESRAALLEHQHQHNRFEKCATESPSQLPSTKHDIVVARHDQGQQVYLRVCSKRDVVCFRFSPEDMSACVSLRWDILLSHLPFFHLPHTPGMNLAFEFHDSWDEGLGMTRESIVRCLSEASERGLAMRAHWAWRKGEIPRWTRMWLIDRSGRVPANYKLSQEDDRRYNYESTYDIKEYRRYKPENHNIFIDGKNKYVESYMCQDQRDSYCYSIHDPDVPILSFIWKMQWLCTPPWDGVFHHTMNTPWNCERFFRVLRQLPGTDGTG